MTHALPRLFVSSAACLALGAILSPLASADILVLKDGRIVDGFDMEQKDGFVAVQMKAGIVEVKDGLVEILLEEDKDISFVPQTDKEREMLDKGYVPMGGNWTKVKTARREIERGIAGRVKQAREDQSHEEWRDAYESETKHFKWKHTVPMTVTQRYMDSCDAYFDVFKKDWGIKRDSKKPKMTINFFADRKEFHRVGGAQGGALAYFMFLGNYDLCAFYDRLDPVFTEQVLFHELGHYLHKLIDEDFKYPHWPGESLCEYYGGAEFNPKTKKLDVGLIHNGRLATIKGEMERGKKIVLRKMITTQGFEDYTWGWSFVHFLMQDKKRAKQFKKFFIGLAKDKKVHRERAMANLKAVKGEEVLRYFMECMKLEDEDELRDLEQEWYDYITEDLEFSGDNALIWEAKQAKSLGERKRAKELYKDAFEENFDGAPANAHFDYAQMLGTRSKDALRHLEAAVAKAPLTAVFRWELAESLEKSKDDDKKKLAETHKALAIELDPDIERNSIRIQLSD